MLKRFSLNFAIFSMIIDGLTVALVLWGVGQVRPLMNASFIQALNYPQSLPISIYISFSILWVSIMAFFNVYDGQKNLRVVDEFTSLTFSAALASITLAGILYLSFREMSRILFLSFSFSTYVAFLLWRVLARFLYSRRNVSLGYLQYVLIVGAGPLGFEIRSRVKRHGHLHINFVGFLDDDPEKRKSNPEILGVVDEARTVIRKEKVTDVIIALPTRAYLRVSQLIIDMQDLPVKVWVVPDYFQFALHHAKVEDFLDIPMLDLRAPALTESQRLIKRIFDLIVAGFMLIPALPLMIVITILIWLDDGAPIFFKQKRVGANGRQFMMYKFRTMVKNAEELRAQVVTMDKNGNVIHKQKNDPRITRMGQILRRLSLDELPQLLNIMRGSMSLVGPRPELPSLVEKYQPWQRKRFAVPQGLTGWWQIHGRSDKPMHLNTEDDLYYIQNYSIWLDINILIQTAWIVIRGKGAY